MKTTTVTLAILLYVVVVSDRVVPARAQTPAPTPVSSQRALIGQYCMGCHSDRLKSGGLALSALNLDAPVENPQSAEIAEKVIRKLRGGLMPPASTPKRPDAHATAEFVSWLENKIDTAPGVPNPGR